MPAITSVEPMGGGVLSESERAPRGGAILSAGERQLEATEAPNAFVRWAFYLSAFSLPFTHVYIPGTGERVGVIRLVQLLLLCAAVIQPRTCLRRVPAALVWLAAYCGLRVLSGLWLSPELSRSWWPATFDWLEFSLPWVWLMFNLLQHPGIGRRGLWALVWGCALCAALHNAGIGVTAVDNSLEEVRTTIWGENANLMGATYAVAVIILIGFAMLKTAKLSRRLLLFPLVALIGLGLARTGSRSALLSVAIGVLVLLFQTEALSSRIARYATLVISVAVFVVIIWQVPTVIERFHDLNPQSINRHEPRARMAPVLWEIFLRSPIYGSGPDQYQFELTRRAMPYLIRDQRTIAAHNLVLMLLVETGIIGLLIFSAGLAQVLAAGWRARLNPCGVLPLALLLPFLVQGLLSGNPTATHTFWFAVAYALAGAA